MRRVADQVSSLGYTLICGPELEFYLCQRDPDGSWRRYADELGNVYVVGRKGDPRGLLLHMLRQGYGYDAGKAEMLPLRLADALDALEADTELSGVLGDYFVTSFLSYKRNEIERFERFVTDWEFREYAYHL